MDNFLVQKLTISNHPVKKLKDKYKLLYVQGLGEFLCFYTKRDPRTKIVFEKWAESILGTAPKEAWNSTPDFYAVKDAVAILRGGMSFYTFRLCFFFDCLYLLEKTTNPPISFVYSFFMTRICGFFSKNHFTYVCEYFEGKNDGEKIPDELRSHRNESWGFVNKKLKRVLIVATMSAGKSTLVNALVGHSVNEVRATACTSKVNRILNKIADEGAVAEFPRKGLRHTFHISPGELKNMTSIGLKFRSTLCNSRICLIDTPGVNFNGDKSHGNITKKAIQDNNYDLILLLLNGQQLAIEDERDLVNFIGFHAKGKKVIGVLNQCDAYKKSQDSIPDAIAACQAMMRDAGIKKPTVVPLSAQTAYLARKKRWLGKKMNDEEEFEFDLLAKKMSHPFYNLPSYLPNVPDWLKLVTPLERSGIQYLEYIIACS